MKWIVEVQVDGDDKWYGNNLLFNTKEEAEESARDLFSRWLITTDWRVVARKVTVHNDIKELEKLKKHNDDHIIQSELEEAISDNESRN